MIERFRLGFANRTLGLRLPAKNRKAGAEMRGTIAAARHHARVGPRALQRSLVIPVFDRAGKVIGDVRPQDHGRSAARHAAASVSAGTAPRRVERSGAGGVERDHLCEALIDALTFWCAGFRNVTASYGVNGFTDDHRAAFRKYGTRRVISPTTAMRRARRPRPPPPCANRAAR